MHSNTIVYAQAMQSCMHSNMIVYIQQYIQHHPDILSWVIEAWPHAGRTNDTQLLWHRNPHAVSFAKYIVMSDIWCYCELLWVTRCICELFMSDIWCYVCGFLYEFI